MRMLWALLICIPAVGSALPKGAVSKHGQVRIESPSQRKMVVHAGDRSVINWESFSIAAGEKAKFVQPHSKATVLNRVAGGVPSEIFGMLKANGHVYLVNPNGVLIGKSGVINAAGFTASTLDALDADFLRGKELRFKGNSRAQLINYGRIEGLEGDVILIGKTIVNEGELFASKGVVGLGAGSEVILRPESEERLYIAPSVSQKEGVGIESKGVIEAATAELKADGNVYRMAINHSGKVEATKLQEKGGRIRLVAEHGVAEVSGEVIAHGGSIHILGEKVGLTQKGFIDVSHSFGGGEVRLGGDYQGGDLLRSKLTFIEKETCIEASALAKGNGGKVIVWSDGGTVFYGGLNAKGGPEGGNGGFVEVSGMEYLDFSGRVSTLAPQGKIGSLLLDPTNVTISLNPDMGATFSGGTYVYSAANANIDAVSLQTNLASSDVIISTSSPFAAAGNMTITTGFAWLANTQLTLISDGNMEINSAGGPSSGGGGDIIVSCGKTLLMDIANIEATALGGNLFVTTGEDCILRFSTINATQGNITMNIGRDLTLQGGAAGPAIIQTNEGLVAIDVGRDLTLLPGAANPALIGTPTTSTTSDIYINRVGRNLRLLNGATLHSQIGHSGNLLSQGDVLIGEIGGDLILQAGSSANSYAQIGHTPEGANHQTRGNVVVGPVHGKILIQGGSGSSAQALVGHGFFGIADDGILEGSIGVIQEVIPATGNDLLLQSGTGTGSSAAIGFINPSGGITGILSEGVSVETNAPITLRTVDGEAQTVIGLFDFDMGDGVALINGVSVKTSRDLILQAGNGNGVSWGFAAIGSALPSLGSNRADSTVTIEARDMYWLTAPLGVPIVQNHSSVANSGERDITIRTRNAFVGTNNTGTDAVIFSGRNLLLIADRDIVLAPPALISAAPFNSGEVTFVVDNAFPSSPELGPGRYESNTEKVLPGGALRIFTSRRIQNSISGPVNGAIPAFFIPGPFLVDSSTEQWGSYFPDSFGGFPFTIFYKEALPPYLNLFGRAMSEMFKNLETYDAFLFAPKCFLLGFDTVCYDERLQRRKGMSSFDLFQDETFQLLRQKYRTYQTKYVESF